MKKVLLLISVFTFILLNSFAQDSLKVIISSKINTNGAQGYLHLEITDTVSNTVKYDSLVYVTIADGFNDTLYLSQGSYRCNILQQDVDVKNPKISLSNGQYPILTNDNSYLFSFPTNKYLIQSNDSLMISISTEISSGANDEWIRLRITDTVTQAVWYDNYASVTLANGFMDSLYLDYGIYKCEVLEIGALVSMPKIILNDETEAVWGYPAYEYYLIPLIDKTISILSQDINEEVHVFPNPTADQIQIKSENSPIISYKIIDIQGRIIKSKTLVNKQIVLIDLENLKSGAYILQYNIDNVINTTTIIKK